MKRFEVLEERIRGAASLIRELRAERDTLSKRVAERDEEIRRLGAEIEELASREPDPAGKREIESLRSERREVLTRVERMLRLLEDVEAFSGQEDLLAAVDGDDRS